MAHIRTDISDARRVYVQTAYGEAAVVAIKRLGAHWDAEKKLWWIGAAKRSDLEAVLVGQDAAQDERGVKGEPEPKENLDDCRVYAQVEYRGRKFYVIAEQRDRETHQPIRCRLTTLDGAEPFWVDCSACNLIRTYEGREVWDGRYCSGKTKTQYQTIGSMRRFRDKQQTARQAGEPACAACGKHGRLVLDHEDGLMKCRTCCDIPADE